VVTTFHDLFVMTGEYSTAEFRKRFTQQAKVAAVNSDLVIAVSAFTANQVADLLHFDRARIRVVPHGIRQPPDEPSQRAREPIVLFVGALQTRKNIVRLVDAFETLPPPWRLVLAGSPNGFGSEAILERIDRSPCRARIDVPGYVEMNELRNLYATASVFAFPSCDEGFGIPVLEAMAAGVPVITSNGSALAEVAGSAALLVDPFDVHSIATGLQALVSNEGLRTRLAAEGRERSKHFTESRTAYETYRVYQEAFAAS
jgi:glycosyltransferase involved in cell wall biosynthesis